MAKTFGFSYVAASVSVAASCFRRFERSDDLFGDFSSGSSSKGIDKSSLSMSAFLLMSRFLYWCLLLLYGF